MAAVCGRQEFSGCYNAGDKHSIQLSHSNIPDMSAKVFPSNTKNLLWSPSHRFSAMRIDCARHKMTKELQGQPIHDKAPAAVEVKAAIHSSNPSGSNTLWPGLCWMSNETPCSPASMAALLRLPTPQKNSIYCSRLTPRSRCSQHLTTRAISITSSDHCCIQGNAAAKYTGHIFCARPSQYSVSYSKNLPMRLFNSSSWCWECHLICMSFVKGKASTSAKVSRVTPAHLASNCAFTMRCCCNFASNDSIIADILDCQTYFSTTTLWNKHVTAYLNVFHESQTCLFWDISEAYAWNVSHKCLKGVLSENFWARCCLKGVTFEHDGVSKVSLLSKIDPVVFSHLNST